MGLEPWRRDYSGKTISQGDIATARGVIERGQWGRRKYPQPLFPPCSLMSLLTMPPIGWTQTEIRLREQLGDAICSSQLPRAQDRTKKDWSLMSQQEKNQHKMTFPTLCSWLVLFQIPSMIKVPNIHIQRHCDIVVNPRLQARRPVSTLDSAHYMSWVDLSGPGLPHLEIVFLFFFLVYHKH